MKVQVIQEFRDKDNFAVVYKAGQIYEFEDERANDIIAKGLAQKLKGPRKVKDD